MLIVVFTCIIVVTTLLPGAAGAEERLTPLSREDAIRMALERNPTLRAKQLELQSVRANETTAALRPNPTLNYLAEQFGAAGQPQYTVSIGQTIETGGKRGRRIESARAATRVTGYELDDVRRQVIFQTKKAFTDVLVAQANQALAAANLTTLDELERIQRLRAERGDISQLELNRIQLQRFA
ncbi:MAG TPA: TolC family protein, partial [Gemmatimonadales bacterium]|nr:TolC family protein [Gemmatimonadales bacterium]